MKLSSQGKTSLLVRKESQRARIYAQAIRPQMVVLPFCMFGAIIGKYIGWQPIALLEGLALLTAAYGAVVIQNDLSDIETDRINQRDDIPFAQGLLSVKQAHQYLFVLASIATTIALFLGKDILMWLILYLLLGWIYSGAPKAKNNGYLAPLILGFCYGVMPWILGTLLAKQSWAAKLLGIATASFIFVSTIILFKDFKDEKGDRATSKRTILVMHGGKVVRYIAIMGTITAFVILGLVAWPSPWSIGALAGALSSFLVLQRSDILQHGQARAVWVGGLRLFFCMYAIITLLMS